MRKSKRSLKVLTASEALKKLMATSAAGKSLKKAEGAPAPPVKSPQKPSQRKQRRPVPGGGGGWGPSPDMRQGFEKVRRPPTQKPQNPPPARSPRPLLRCMPTKTRAPSWVECTAWCFARKGSQGHAHQAGDVEPAVLTAVSPRKGPQGETPGAFCVTPKTYSRNRIGPFPACCVPSVNGERTKLKGP